MTTRARLHVRGRDRILAQTMHPIHPLSDNATSGGNERHRRAGRRPVGAVRLRTLAFAACCVSARGRSQGRRTCRRATGAIPGRPGRIVGEVGRRFAVRRASRPAWGPLAPTFGESVEDRAFLSDRVNEYKGFSTASRANINRGREDQAKEMMRFGCC